MIVRTLTVGELSKQTIFQFMRLKLPATISVIGAGCWVSHRIIYYLDVTTVNYKNKSKYMVFTILSTPLFLF